MYVFIYLVNAIKVTTRGVFDAFTFMLVCCFNVCVKQNLMDTSADIPGGAVAESREREGGFLQCSGHSHHCRRWGQP